MKIEAGGPFTRAAQKFGDSIALTTAAGSLSFDALNRSANRIGSGLLGQGLDRGDRVAVLSHNRAEIVQLWLGLEKQNLVRTVLHSHFEMAVHVETLADVGARALVFDTRFSAAIEAIKGALKTVTTFVAMGPDAPDWAIPYSEIEAAGSPRDAAPDVDEDAPCFLQLTTGTTGKPKPWIVTHRSWRTLIDFNLEHLDTFAPDIPSLGPSDVNLHFHALQWATGFQTLLPYLLRGARSVVVDDESFDPEVILDAIVREGVTGALVPAPMLNPLLDVVEARGGIDHNLQRLVIFFATPEQLERTTSVLGPIWCHGFGATEQGAPTTRLTYHEASEKPGRMSSVGRNGSPFFEVAIMDEKGARLDAGKVGEIVVRSPMSTSTYWNMPEKTAEAFFPNDWFRPSDIGYLDEDGFLYYLDRAKDRISTAQGVVYPHVVESVLLRHAAVANCGVVGLGAAGSQEVVAGMILKDGTAQTPALEREIIAAGKSSLEDHECPARIVFLSELPTVLGGAKVQREVLKGLLLSKEKTA